MSYYKNALEIKPILDLGYLSQKVGIVAEDKPVDLPSRPGYAWKPLLDGTTIGWEEVEDPNAQGTSDNPIEWTPGMKVRVNYWYIYNDIRYVCVQSGNPVDITDTAYFEQM